MKRPFLLVVFAALVAAAASADSIVLETESFDDWGGWVNDTQFMDQMGSPYLLAHGMGKPVADAKTTFAVKKDGVYNVWVRTKNWLAWVKGCQGQTWDDVVPGCFNLIVNGQQLPNRLGVQAKGEWKWVKADNVVLKAGENTVALHDLDGFDGRCDAIVFTTEANPDCDAIRQAAVPAARPAEKEYDVIVVGGGIAGICSAVSASRLGLQVALIHDRPVLGGNNSSEVRVHLGAWQNMPPYPRLGDIVAEIGPRNEGNARPKATYEDERKLSVVKAEKNLDLFLNQHMNAVEKDATGRIVSVTAQNTRTGERVVYKAAQFVDCTGDGTVGFLAGADYRQGREARSVHNEPWAPEREDTLTMGASVQWYAGTNEECEMKNEECLFPKLPWMVAFNEKSASRDLRGDWWWEAGLGRDQIQEAEYIRDYGLLVAYSNWAYLKNESSRKKEYADKELKWVAYNAGRRESRRLMGDFILTENDLMNKNFQPDGTCATTWTIDLHFPKTKEDTHFEGEPFQTDSLNHVVWAYPVPYRCYYSRNVPNLFMAGRNISVTHVALGTTRLMRTHGMMGEVVGMAASLCKKYGCSPRDVYTSHMDELKALMEKGVGDGKVHPPQMYNIQDSLDPVFKDRKGGNHQLR